MPIRIPLAVRLAIVAAIIFVAFTLLGSFILLGLTGLFRAVPHPFWAWWLFLFAAGGDRNTQLWLLISGTPATVVPLTVAGVMLYRSKRFRAWSLRRNPAPTRAVPAPIRAATDNYGHARWMTIAEAKRTWPGPDPAYGGVVIGEAYDPLADRVANIPFDPSNRATWGQGGSAPLLIDPCRGTSTHSLLFSGSGGYKTTGSAVPTLLHWRGSAIVLDPSLELSPMLADARRRMQHEVFTLHPETAHVVGFNALEWIDINSPMAETDILSVVEWICGEVPSDNATAAFFMGRGKALVACLLAHMLWAEDLSAELKTLRTLRAALVTPRVRAARDPVGNSPILALSHGPRSRRHPEGSRRRDFQRYLCERRRVHVLAFQSGLCRNSSAERRSAPLTLRTGGRRCSLPCRSRPCRARRPWPVP